MTTSVFEFPIASARAMQKWGERFAACLRPTDVVALMGPMGSGKTTCMQGIAQGWGAPQKVTSPTFALVNEYVSDRGVLYHMDLYRLTPPELGHFELEDYLQSEGVCLIEWADRAGKRIPASALQIHFRVESKNKRTICLRGGSSWKKRLNEWAPK